VSGVTSTDVAERVLLAGERLIAEHGVDVSLRDIALAAGQRNNSAVHYYFGGRDALIDAIVERRLADMEKMRLEMLAANEAEGQGEDLRTLVTMLVEPMLAIPPHQGTTHYARFLQVVRNHPAVADPARLSGGDRPAVRIITARLDRCLAALPAQVRRRRLEAMASTMFALLADHERASEQKGTDAGADRRIGQEIVDMLVGLLAAEATSAGRGRARATAAKR
jgi:AcrR family transcriptional regulator